MKATMLFLVALVVTASLTAGIGGGVSNAADNLEAMTAAAASKWKAQREGVVTGHFSVRLYTYSRFSYTRNIPVQEFRALIDGKDASGLEAVLEKFQGLRGEPSNKSFKPHWGVPIEISCEGIKWRNEWKGSPYSLCVFNGNERIEYKAGINQATIMPGRTNLGGFGLDDLCDLPKESVANEILDSKDKRLESGKVVVDFAKQKIVVDPATGFIDLHSYIGSQKRFKEIRQVGPMQLEGGFVFPRARATVEYEADHLRFFSFILIDNVELNQSVSPEAFMVSAPEKTRIVDTREKTQGFFPSRDAQKAVPDVLKYADSGEVKRFPGTKGPQPFRARWLYALLTLPFVILTIRLLIRKWKERLSKS